MIPEKIKHYFRFEDLKTEVVEGNVERVVYSGEKIQAIEYHFPPNKTFPMHSHAKEEQMGYLVSGKMGFMVDGEEKMMLPGDFYRAPVGVEHNARTFDEPAVLLDFFVPPRDDLTSNELADE